MRTLISRGAASRAAAGLNQTLSEIAAEVRGLKAQATVAAPGAGAEPAAPDVAEPNSELDPAKPEPEPPPQPAASANHSAAATVHSAAANPTRQEMPTLADMRPELAAFVAAAMQQHQATVRALQQVTENCRLQQLQIERLTGMNAELANRIRVQSQRM